MNAEPEPIDLGDLLPIPEGASFAHIAPSTLRGLLSSGRLTRFHVLRRVFVSRTELTGLVQTGTQSGRYGIGDAGTEERVEVKA